MKRGQETRLDCRRLNMRKLDTACLLAAHGLTDDNIAQVLHVSSDTLIKWRGHEYVGGRLKKARENPEDEVERSLYLRAVGFDRVITSEQEGGKDDGKTVRTHERVAGDVGACIAWLANRRPDKWKRNPNGYTINVDNRKIEIKLDELRGQDRDTLVRGLRELISQGH